MATPEEIRRAREATAYGGLFNNFFATNRAYRNRLAQQGRRPVLGGLLSKEPVMGTDTLRYEGIRPFVGNLLEPIIRGADAPRAASQGLIPQDDMVGEAFGTAGAAMVGGGAVAKPSGALGSNAFRDAPLEGFEGYLSRVNPSGKRIAAEDRPNLMMGDMYGMLPRNSDVIGEKGGVTFHRSPDGDYYATAYNPDVGEQDVVGYITDRGDSTELQVVAEMQGQGIGGELQYLFRSENPDAPTGGLTEAGERSLERTYDRMFDEGLVSANASKGTGAMTLWHGSPYDFNEFDLSKIGTGEGAQDLGRGFSLTDYEANAHLYTNPASRWGDLAAMQRYRQAGSGRYYQVNVGAAPEQFLDWNKPWRDQVPEETPLYDALAKREAVMLSQYADDPAMQAAIPRGKVSNMWRDNSGLEDAALQSGFVGNSRRNYSGDTEYTVFDPSLLRIDQKFDADGNVVSANASKPIGLLVLEQQARGNSRLGGLLESQGMDISDLSTASPTKIESVLDTAVKRGILDPRSAAGLKRGILDGL